MSYETLTSGIYRAQIIDWGLEEVEKLKQLKAVIKFAFKCNDKEMSINWDGLFYKKDGSANEKTLKTLKTCGFNKKSVAALTEADALDTTKVLSLDIRKDGDYFRVEWVNDGAKEMTKIKDVKKIKGYDLRKIDSMLALSAEKPKIKNHAPVMDENEELPF